MSMIDFKHLKVTTMTVVMPLKGMVNSDQVFPLLEITRLDLPPQKRQTQKYKIPFCKIPGAILSARYRGFTRGIIKSQNKKYFLNAITIDISTSEKNVNIKLSKSKMQMCGATSVRLAKEAAQHIIQKLYDTQDDIEYLNDHPEMTQQCLEWIKEVTRGQEIMLPPFTRDEDQVDPVIVHTLQLPEELPAELDLDKRIVMFLIRQAPDFAIYEDYCIQLDWVCTLKMVITKPLEVIEVIKVMVNFNYDLGFNINRWALSQYINGFNGFTARYENTLDHSVTIELPYTPVSDSKITRRKDKVPCHTFLVYKSGLVTQSGPNEDLMEGAYYKFNETINQIRPYIIKPGVKRKLKYKPVYNNIKIVEIPTETQVLVASN